MFCVVATVQFGDDLLPIEAVVVEEAPAQSMLRVRPAVAPVMTRAEADRFPVSALHPQAVKPHVRRIAWRATADYTWLPLQPFAIFSIYSATSLGLGMLHPISAAN